MKKVYVVTAIPRGQIEGIYTSFERLYADGDLSNQYTKAEVKARIETGLPVFFFGMVCRVKESLTNQRILI